MHLNAKMETENVLRRGFVDGGWPPFCNRTGFSLPHVVDVSWRLDYYMKVCTTGKGR